MEIFYNAYNHCLWNQKSWNHLSKKFNGSTVTLPLKFQHKLAFVDWLGVILIVNKILSNPLKFKHVQIFLGSTTILCKANLPNSISVLSKSTPILWLNRPWEPFTKLSSSCFQKMIFLSTGFCNIRLKFFNGDPDPFHFSNKIQRYTLQ